LSKFRQENGLREKRLHKQPLFAFFPESRAYKVGGGEPLGDEDGGGVVDEGVLLPGMLLPGMLLGGMVLGVTVPVLPGHGLATVADVPVEVPAVPVAPGVELLLDVALVPVLPDAVVEPDVPLGAQFTVLVVLAPGMVPVVL